MNIQRLLPLLALSCAFAVNAAAKSHGGGDKPRGPKEDCGECSGPALAGLTEAERAKFKAAAETAAKDPAFVKAKEAADAAREKAKESKSKEDRKAAMEAGKAAHEAHKAAMLKADPSIGDILAKVEKARPEHGGKGPRGEKGKGRKGGEGAPEAKPGE